ncbi:hypothetical protein G9A89_021264 [Geosiphon pyriformis]|nr:hypothetical protein G9A89_021264 [Geosiphon pyriformis]
MIDLSASPLGLADIGNVNGMFSKSWGSKIESKMSSVSSLLDLENMKNTIAEKISYANSDASVVNDMANNTTPRKMCTYMYVLGQPLKTLLFDVLSDNNDLVAFLSPKFAGSKKLLSVGSHASEKHIFNSVKSFTLDIGFSALPGKTIGNKLITVKKMFYWIDGFGGHLLFQNS